MRVTRRRSMLASLADTILVASKVARNHAVFAANCYQDRFPECRHENVVQGSAESPEGDGSTHQPHIPLPAKPLARPSLAVREREPANRGSHCRLRRVHEPGVGRRRGVLSEDEGQETSRTDHAEGRQYHSNTEHESRS